MRLRSTVALTDHLKMLDTLVSDIIQREEVGWNLCKPIWPSTIKVFPELQKVTYRKQGGWVIFECNELFSALARCTQIRWKWHLCNTFKFSNHLYVRSSTSLSSWNTTVNEVSEYYQIGMLKTIAEVVNRLEHTVAELEDVSSAFKSQIRGIDRAICF